MVSKSVEVMVNIEIGYRKRYVMSVDEFSV